MEEVCQKVLASADRRPIPPGHGLPVRQAAKREIGKGPTVCVFNRMRESFLCVCAVVGGTSSTPPLGARGFPASEFAQLASLSAEDGLWLMPPPGVFSVGALFPVDMVYLDRGNRVVDLVEHLDPLRIVPVRCGYASVLKLRTRTIYSSYTRVGDELLICSPEDVKAQWEELQAQRA